MQEMGADGSVIRFHLDAPAVQRVVTPVKQDRGKTGQQAIGDGARPPGIVIVFFRQERAQHGTTRAQHIHGVGGGRDLFQRGP